MGNSWFQFQQFRIHQDRCAMKISTDAVLLGALADKKLPLGILDIGTGTGVIGLMLAQRFSEALITGVELDPEAARQAEENFQESPFSERLQLIEGSFQALAEDIAYDLIVSNPPYFPDHLKSKDSKRNQALHTDALSFEELIKKAAKILSKDGELWIILPPRQMKDLENLAANEGLFSIRRIWVKDRKTKPVIREIVGFSRMPRAHIPTEVILKNEDGTFSDPYSNLISGFLLGF